MLVVFEYRIIAKGASGGMGIGNPVPALVSYASRVRAVFSLQGGTQIYFLIGQEGLSVNRDVNHLQYLELFLMLILNIVPIVASYANSTVRT